MSELSDFYIKQLEHDKAELERKIEAIRREISTINTLIYRRKSQSFAKNNDEKINKRNVDRLFYESLIVDILKSSEAGMKASQVFRKIGELGYGVNYNTFRSYIASMHTKGVIKKKSSASHVWIVS